MAIRPAGMSTPYDGLNKESTETEKLSVAFEILKKSSPPIWLDYKKLFIAPDKEKVFDAKIISTGFVETSGNGYHPAYQINNKGVLALDGVTYLEYIGQSKRSAEKSIQMITSELKDKVLGYICANCPLERLVSEKTSTVLKELDLEFDTFNGIMSLFSRYGFVNHLDVREYIVSFSLKAEAHDYLQQGGFMVQEEIFKTNIQRLGYEIEVLQKAILPDNIESVNKIASIAGNLLNGLTFLKGL